MAKAESILVNDNITTKNTALIDQFINSHIFLNSFIRHPLDLIQGSEIIELDERYDYRPDRLAYDMYGHDFWYPAILAANNLGSMIQFKAENLNHKCVIPSSTAIQELIAMPVEEIVTIETIVTSMFKK